MNAVIYIMVKRIKDKFFYEPGDTVLLLEECRRAIVTAITDLDSESFSQKLVVEFRNGETANVDSQNIELLFRKK